MSSKYVRDDCVIVDKWGILREKKMSNNSFFTQSFKTAVSKTCRNRFSKIAFLNVEASSKPETNP